MSLECNALDSMQRACHCRENVLWDKYRTWASTMILSLVLHSWILTGSQWRTSDAQRAEMLPNFATEEMILDFFLWTPFELRVTELREEQKLVAFILTYVWLILKPTRFITYVIKIK